MNPHLNLLKSALHCEFLAISKVITYLRQHKDNIEPVKSIPIYATHTIIKYICAYISLYYYYTITYLFILRLSLIRFDSNTFVFIG